MAGKSGAVGVAQHSRFDVPTIDREQTALAKRRYDRQAGSYDKRVSMMERLAFGKPRERLW